jgi:alpha-tubulin suppressor-like RCC1 family protein
VVAGESHTCVIEGSAAGSDAAAYCWGSNSLGQLGDGSTVSSSTPVKVITVNGGFTNNGAVSELALGGAHTCAIEAGVAYCWGAELGVTDPAARPAPVKVPDVDGVFTNADVAALSSGGGTAANGTACVIRSGAVLCWGANDQGQLGIGTRLPQTGPTSTWSGTPPTVPSPPSLISVAYGFGHLSLSFAPGATGGLAITNYEYSINGGTTWVPRTPANTSSPWVITGLDNGTTYTVLLRAVNGAGQSAASTSRTGTPSESWTNATAEAVAGGGSHSCALTGGVLWCWGENNSGQLGDGTTNGSLSPKRVPSVSGGFSNDGSVSAIALGGAHTCAIEAGIVYCWGANTYGQLGDGSTAPSATPVKVLPVTGGLANNGDVTSVSIGDDHTCVIEAGVAHCWGANTFGQLGDGSQDTATTAVKVAPVNGGFLNNGTVSALALGGTHTCALEGGIAYCWGANSNGQLGDGSLDTATTAAKVSPVNGGFVNNGTVSALALGGAHSCVIEGGIAYCWGANDSGQLGIGSQNQAATATKVTTVTGFPNNGSVSLLALSGTHTCALQGGVVYCWGIKLGVSPSTVQSVPELVPNGDGFTNSGVLGLSSGGESGSGTSCLIKNGSVLCWGANDFGQLGTGDLVSKSGPTPAAPASGGTIDDDDDEDQGNSNNSNTGGTTGGSTGGATGGVTTPPTQPSITAPIGPRPLTPPAPGTAAAVDHGGRCADHSKRPR